MGKENVGGGLGAAAPSAQQLGLRRAGPARDSLGGEKVGGRHLP